MTPSQFQARVLDPARALFPFRDCPESRALLLAIAGQESGWCERRQVPGQEARGWFMFELGGVDGVMTHPASRPLLQAFCTEMEIPWANGTIHEACAWHDGLAYALARLLLWTDSPPLPAVGDSVGGCATYRRLWRPGRFDQLRWDARWEECGACIA
jgi:hypothetical protein